MRITATVIREIVEREDAKGCVYVAEALRQMGKNYDEIASLVFNLTGLSQGEWDELLREGEGG